MKLLTASLAIAAWAHRNHFTKRKTAIGRYQLYANYTTFAYKWYQSWFPESLV